VHGGVSLSREAFDAGSVNDACVMKVGRCSSADGRDGPKLDEGLAEDECCDRRIRAAGNDDTELVRYRRRRHGICNRQFRRLPPGNISWRRKAADVGPGRVERRPALLLPPRFDVSFVEKAGAPAHGSGSGCWRSGWPRIPASPRSIRKGHPALTRRGRTCWRVIAFAVGDAAGYVNPFTGRHGWGDVGWPLSPNEFAPWDRDHTRSECGSAHRRLSENGQRAVALVSRVIRLP